MEPIWQALQEAYSPGFQSSAYSAQLKQVDVYCKKIEAAFSPEFLDELWEELSALAVIETGEAFLSGLQLGAGLMCELFPRP